MDSNRLLSLLALGALALTSGCARFENPAVADSGPAFDPALEGRWQLRNEDERAELEIQWDASGGLVTVHTEEGSKQKIERARLVTARIGQLNLASVQSLKGSDRGFWSVFRYDLEGTLLTITPGDDSYWKKAIEDGRIDGKVERGPLATAITVTASEARLREIISSHGAVIFAKDPSPEVVFERVR